MQFSTLITCFIAAVSINAAPAPMSKRLSDIPIKFYSGAKCDTSVSAGVTTIYLPTDGKCFGTSPIISGNTDSAIIDTSVVKSLPAGCSSKFQNQFVLILLGCNVLTTVCVCVK